MNIFKTIKNFYESLTDKLNDPVYNCDVYKKEGCSHVDGLLCDMETCSCRKEKEIANDQYAREI